MVVKRTGPASVPVLLVVAAAQSRPPVPAHRVAISGSDFVEMFVGVGA